MGRNHTGVIAEIEITGDAFYESLIESILFYCAKLCYSVNM